MKRNRMKIGLMGLLAAISLITLLVATTAISFAQPKESYTFYMVSHGGPATPFWEVVIRGMNDAAKLLGVKAVYLGPEKFSIKEVVDMLEGAIARKPHGIAVTITAVEPLDRPVRRAIELGIPVIAMNVKDPRPPEKAIPYLCYVGTDQYLTGVYAARRILREYTPKRAVAGIQEVGHIGLEARAKGFMDVLGEKGVPVEKLDITTDIAKGVEILRSYLVRHPDTDTIFTTTRAGAESSVKVIEEQKLAGKVRLVNTDLSPTIINAIKKGTMIATAEQQQYLQGYLPILYLYTYNKYGLCPTGDVLTGPFIVDKSNVSVVERTVAEKIR
jgi:simple sugar transport system substrate-binding protein